jgi:hypothetical protein
MKFSDYDAAYCLCVDYRFRTEFARVAGLLGDRGRGVTPFIDGKGKVLSSCMYNQISPTPPPGWLYGPGAYAHFHGTKGIIREAKRQRARHVLFVEDDLILAPEFDRVVEQATGQIEAEGIDWDVLYYGANHTPAVTKNLGENVMRVFGSFTTHCMGVRESIYDAILALPEIHVIDNVIASSLHHQFKFLSVWPNVALQKPGFSYLWRKDADYTELFRSRGSNS